MKLADEDRRLLALLGLPTLALSLAITTASGLAPVLIERISGPAVTGLLLATEGVFALVVPLFVGKWSDRLQTPIGGRLPFLLAAAVVGAAALTVIPLAGSLAVLGAALLVLYLAYFVYFSPYWALFPDLVPDGMRGRSQGSMGVFRAVGLGAALVGGPFLLALWQPLPFVLAAGVLVGVTGVFALRIKSRLPGEERASSDQFRSSLAVSRGLVEERPGIAWIMVANALWESALSALRAFVVLFLTVGVGRSLESASGLLALVALTSLLAAPLAGTLADRFGDLRVLRLALWVYGLGLLLPFFTQSTPVLVALPVIAFAAVTVMTLPFSVLMGLLPEQDHGAAAGLFGFSRGIGLVLGPLSAGLAVTLLEPLLQDTNGYAAVFLVAAVAVLASIPALRRVAVETPASGS